MTSVALKKYLWLNDAADLASSVRLVFLAGSGETWPVPITRWTGAAGRRRAIRTPRGSARVWTPSIARVTPAVARELQERAGRLHWARDPLGGKVTCYWDDAPITWRGAEGPRGEQMVGVSLTLQEVTHAEAATRLAVS